MTNGLVSVILPVHNGENFLAKAIQSVLNQEEKNFELLVLDNGSKDQTGKIAQSFPGVRYFYSEIADVNLARNRGIEEAKGEWIAFIDHDDLWLSHKLKTQLAFLRAHPEFEGSIGLQKICLEPGMAKPHWLKQELADTPHIAYFPSALLVKKEVFARIGTFSLSYAICGDADWFFKARQANVPIAEIPEILIHKRIHRDNITHDWTKVQKELLLIMKHSIAKQSNASQN